MLNGNALGVMIANTITDPSASPQARAVIINHWINISSIIVTYFQANATIISNPLTIGAPVPAPDGVAVLSGPTGPVGGTINILPISSRLM